MTTMADVAEQIDANSFTPFIFPKGDPAWSGEFAPIEGRASEREMKKIL